MKTIANLIFATFLVAAALAPRPAAAQPGAPRGTTVDDKDVVKAAQFAVDAQQKAMSAAGQTDKLTLVKIDSARKQVVAGVNFLLTLEVKQGDKTRTASAKVWWQAWRKPPFQLTSWTFTADDKTHDDIFVTGRRSDAKDLFDLIGASTAVASNNDFAVKLYRQLAKEKHDKNLFFSPFSMTSALAMAVNGARGGETATEMAKVLCFSDPFNSANGDGSKYPWDMASINAGLARLNDRFNPKPAAPETLAKIAELRKQFAASRQVEKNFEQANNWQQVNEQNRKSQNLAEQLNALLAQVNQYELRVANALWAEKTYPFSPAYLETVHKFYGTGGAFPVDFKGNPEGERQKINAWVEQQTNNRIRDLMPAGSIDALTRLVLTNAIYFKGEWATPFEEASTKEEDFLDASGAKVRTAMMHKDGLGRARYAAFNADGSLFATPRMITRDQAANQKALYPDKGGFLVAELPYKGGDLAMVAIVPQDADGLAALEEKLTSAKLQAWLGKLEAREVNVQLPKFKFETEYQMNDTLKTLGMVRAFSPGKAQFDGMTTSQDPANRLYIATVVHKAFVEVNEKGTEAAAATGVAMEVLAVRVNEPFTPTFRADRPFLFAIRDVKTGTILFLGRLTSPKG